MEYRDEVHKDRHEKALESNEWNDTQKEFMRESLWTGILINNESTKDYIKWLEDKVNGRK